MVTISQLLRPFTRRVRPAALAAAEPTAQGAPAELEETPVEAAQAEAAQTEVAQAEAAQSEDTRLEAARVEAARLEEASAVVEATIVEYSVPTVVHRPVDRDTSRAEEALYELVRERVLGMVGPGGTFTVSMRTAQDDDLFFSQAFAQLIARELVSQLHASARPSAAEVTASTSSPAAIGAGRGARVVHTLSHEPRLIA